MKLFNVVEEKNLLVYLITPYFVKEQFFSDADLEQLKRNNLEWNLKANESEKAESYDARHGYLTGEGSGYPLIQLIEKSFSGFPLGKVLEIGAGSGFLTAKLASQSSFWRVLELVPELAERIKKIKEREKLNQIEVIQKSIFEFEDSPDSYDTIFLFHTLHHLTDRKEIIKKIYRWLRPGGFLFSLEPRHNLQRMIQLFRKYLLIYRKELIRQDRFVTHDFVCKTEFRQLLRQAGFSNWQMEAYDFPLLSRFFDRQKYQQFQFEAKITKIPVVEHFGRFLFLRAVK